MTEILTGPNFSGRTEYLKRYVGYPGFANERLSPLKLVRDVRKDYYIGPIPDAQMSGLMDRVDSELFLGQRVPLVGRLDEFLTAIRFKELMHRNPYTLSGGERVILTVSSYALRNPSTLCLDSTLEQLSNSWKKELLCALHEFGLPEILISDNRWKEMDFPLKIRKASEKKNEALPFDPIASSEFTHLNPCDPFHVNVENLHFSYGSKAIFRGFDLEIQSGEVCHIKGANGTGKSTLSKILCGVLKPSQETRIFFNGDSIHPFHEPGRHFAYSFQQPDDQLFGTTVYDEFMVRRKPKQNTDGAVRAFGLNNHLTIHPLDLPLVMRKRLSLASVLSGSQSVVILDEPTLYLDDESIAHLVTILKNFVESGRALLLITHSDSFPQLLKDEGLKVRTLEIGVGSS